MLNIELQLDKLSDERYIIDLGDDREIEITLDDGDIAIEIHTPDGGVIAECSARIS